MGNPEEAIRTYAANAGMTKLTSVVIAISLVTTIYGLSVACARIRDGGDSDALARLGLLLLQVGAIGWVLAQGVHIMLADVPQSDEGVASSLSAYSVDEGITRLGGLMVSAGFLLFSLGLAVRGGLYKTTGLLIALVSLVALGSPHRRHQLAQLPEVRHRDIKGVLFPLDDMERRPRSEPA